MIYRLVWDFMRKNKKQYLLGFLALALSAGLSVFMPKLLGYITDGLSEGTMALNEAFFNTALTLLLAVGLFGLKFCYRMMIVGKSRDLECHLRDELFTKLQILPPSFYNKRKTGDLMAYATNDLTTVRMAFAMGILFLVDGILVQGLSVVAMSVTINPLLTFLAVGPVILSVIITFKMRLGVRDRFKLVQDMFSELSDKIQENISGIRVIKAYQRERGETERLKEASLRKYDIFMDYVKLSSALPIVTTLCFGITFSVALGLGAQMVGNGQITLGDFTAFFTYLALMVNPVSHLSRIVELWQRAVASLKRLEEILFIEPEIRDENVSEKSIQGQIDINGLTFYYPDTKTPALSGLDVHLEKGKLLGIIGRTGSGKTTLTNLLLRLYNVKDGSIRMDKTDINRIPLKTLRESIGYVPQDNFLFGASIMDNIRFFDQAISDEQVFEAAKLACIYDDIAAFPEGFNTVVGERGITLSGGQKQRISIARAIVKKPRILILDDALSAVDTETEERILYNLKTVLENTTGIIVAHRTSAVKDADEIIFLESGKIVERGNHAALLDLGGKYASLCKLQSGG